MQKSLTLIFLLCWVFNILTAQETTTEKIPKKIYTTQKIMDTPPSIDGVLDDACWNQVEWGNGFLENQPTDGAKASQETAFKILYDDANLYIAYRCFDTAPDSIVKRMSRRDGFAGDWVEINIDSYHDLRTGFSFTSSVSGVKGDEFISNDGNNWDANWNPIWYLRTQIDDQGWTAEVRIPFSQLRFGDKEEQVWGIQFTRRDFRDEARSIWQYVPNTAGYWVSGFGELHGIKGIKPQKQIEIQPYLVAQTESFEKQEGNPFATGSDNKITAGLDGKIGITNDLTLDFTVNPDFGQVEADPSVLVLDESQVFFQERRPFFIENRNVFDYQISNSAWGGNFDSDNLFYSRRIGSVPHDFVRSDAENNYYADQPDNTTILGAAKFSGKTEKGLAIGVLEAVTDKEWAKIDDNGEESKILVEPLSNYFVGRATQDFDSGNTVIGGVFTATNRQLKDTDLDFLHESAYSGGVDFVHRWKDRAWAFKATGLLSRVNGSTRAITNTQRQFEHYFQRPDAEHLSVDTTATSLVGHGGTVSVGKYGGNFKFEFGATWRSPELELNDIGFQRNADEIANFIWVGYHIQKPFGIFRSLRMNMGGNTVWDFGGTVLSQGFGINAQANFKNLWNGSLGIFQEITDVSNRALFGGPALRKPTGNAIFGSLSSNQNLPIGMGINFTQAWGEKAVRHQNYGVSLRIQPSNAFNISLNPGLTIHQRIVQYARYAEFNDAARYIAGSLDRYTLSLTARMDYNITPNLTLQYYGQPFISRGRYFDIKNLTDPLNKKITNQFDIYNDNQISFDEDEDIYSVDEDMDGEIDYTFSNPDFNFIQFRSNLVARWEYVPGSELFFVWSQGTTNFGDPSEQLLPSLKNNLFSRKINNIFLVKATYRFLL